MKDKLSDGGKDDRPFAARFEGMSREQIRTMMAESFAFEECLVRHDLVALLRQRLSGPTSTGR